MAFLRSSKNTDAYKRHLRFEENRTVGFLNVVVVLAVCAVAYTDWQVVANISLGYLYVLPIALCALINPLPITIALAVLCTILEELFGPAPDLDLRIYRVVIGLAGFLIVGFVVTLIARQRDPPRSRSPPSARRIRARSPARRPGPAPGPAAASSRPRS